MSKYWTTKEGKKILISDLETGHLNNIINMMQRNGTDMNRYGNDGSDGFDPWYDDEINPLFEALLIEREKREV